jgi:hypothetical protein
MFSPQFSIIELATIAAACMKLGFALGCLLTE